MPCSLTDPPFLFLSSPVRGIRPLRKAIHDLALASGRHVWVDEVCDERDLSGEDHLTNVDKLFDHIRASSIYVGLLAVPQLGTPIELDGHPSSVSFFEIELFRAALLNKPVVVLIHQDFEPDPELAELLGFLLPAFPRGAVRTGQTDASIRDAIERLLHGDTPGSLGMSRVPLVKRLAQRFFDRRGRFASRAFGTSPLLLLNHQSSLGRMPSRDVVHAALASEAAQVDEELRLGRLWIAVRELSGAPFWMPGHEAHWPDWAGVLSAWIRAAAWYGMHAHLWLGCVAGANSLAWLARSASAGAAGKDNPTYRHPAGSLASAWYSASKHLWWPWDRWRALSVAEEELGLALADPHSNRANTLAIRGSVYRQQLRFWSAVSDYEEVVRLRERAGADAGSLGEGLAELGFGYLLTFRPRKGVAYLEEGVKLISASDKRAGFKGRAYRKLAFAYRVTGRITLADHIDDQARVIAEAASAHDQLRN